MRDLKNKTVKGGAWSFVAKVVTQGISFILGVVLARLLVPDDFGLVAMVIVFTGFAEMLANFGIGSALVQKKEISDQHYSSIFVLNVVLGLILSLGFYASSEIIAEFYNRTELIEICRAMAVILVLASLSQVPRSILIRNMMFREIALSESAALLISGVVGVALAANAYGYWSLVLMIISRQALLLVFFFYASSWLPSLFFRWSVVGQLMNFSVYVFGTKTLQYISGNLDKMLIGRVLGAGGLGIYEKAQSMMLFPIQNISQVVGSVMFPALSSIQDDKKRVKSIYLRATSSIAIITFPMMIGLYLVSDLFVELLLGDKWLDIIPIIKILCFAGIATSIATVTGSVYLSQGAAQLQFKVNILMQGIKIISVIIGLEWGIIGVAIGYSSALMLNSFIAIHVAGRLIEMRLSELLFRLLPIFLVSLVMGVVVWSVRALNFDTSHLMMFIAQILCGVGVYVILLVITRLTAFADLTSTLKSVYSK